LLACACAGPGDAPKVDDSVAALVLTEVPSDVQNRAQVDFGGAVHLVGWDLSPSDRATPGSTIHLKLYWRAVKQLSPGWKLFTHITTADAPKPYAFDDVGTLRQKLSASDFVPGTVYVDAQDIVIPDTRSPEVTLAVGVGHGPMQEAGAEIEGLSGSRLEILSGLSDGHNRAVLARLVTGVTPGQKAEPRPERRRGLPPNFKGRMPQKLGATDPKEKP
jgi:hypothetical protein